jgi:hypothetical protein
MRIKKDISNTIEINEEVPNFIPTNQDKKH